MQWLTHADFADRVGDVFEVPDPGVELLLSEAIESSEPGGSGPDGQQRHQFSLSFRGPAEPFLPQATYALTHADLGALSIFLVPIGQDSDGTCYEAAFA